MMRIVSINIRFKLIFWERKRKYMFYLWCYSLKLLSSEFYVLFKRTH